MKMKVCFFENGNTMFFDGVGQQVPEFQESWLILYVQFLIANGIDPTEVEFIMPDNHRMEVFKTRDGYNWQNSR